MSGYDYRVPSVWMRVLGTVGAAYLVVDGARGVLRNDLHVFLTKGNSPGVHLHGPLAWFCFAGMVMMAVGVIRFLAPEPGEGEFDFDTRRGRFGPLFLIGLVLYAATQAIAGWRS